MDTETLTPGSIPVTGGRAGSLPRRGPIVGTFMQVTPDVAMLQTMIVNLFFVGSPVGNPAAGRDEWVLVDAGMPMSAGRILRAAEDRFGRGARPRAIVLTHGHFDHVGALKTLVEHWDVPVYAHELELPYLTGRSEYPPPDPTVGGGMMARMAYLYPDGPIDLGPRAVRLPDDGTVPGMPGWRWVHTPGHTPGHVALFRESDRVLIAGDAFVTTKQESFLAVMTQRKELHGPPMYFTPDWPSARESVRRLAALRPHLALTGHGLPMANPRLDHDLNELARHFDELAVPIRGRYVREPAVADANGVMYVPPPVPDPFPTMLLLIAVGAAAAAIVPAMMTREED